jgi:hypothetical protein
MWPAYEHLLSWCRARCDEHMQAWYSKVSDEPNLHSTDCTVQHSLVPGRRRLSWQTRVLGNKKSALWWDVEKSLASENDERVSRAQRLDSKHQYRRIFVGAPPLCHGFSRDSPGAWSGTTNNGKKGHVIPTWHLVSPSGAPPSSPLVAESVGCPFCRYAYSVDVLATNLFWTPSLY